MGADIAPLVDEAAKVLAASLAPVGTAAAGEIGSRLTGEAVVLAKALWARMRGRLPDPAQIERDAALAQEPDSPAATHVQQELRRQLLEALTADASFAAELRAALGPQNPQPAQQNIGVQQTGPVHGGTVSGSVKAKMG